MVFWRFSFPVRSGLSIFSRSAYLATEIGYTVCPHTRFSPSRIASIAFTGLAMPFFPRKSAVGGIVLPAFEVYRILLLVIVGAVVGHALDFPLYLGAQGRALLPLEIGGSDVAVLRRKVSVSDYLKCAGVVAVVVEVVDYAAFLVLGLVGRAVLGVVLALDYKAGQDVVDAPARLGYVPRGPGRNYGAQRNVSHF